MEHFDCIYAYDGREGDYEYGVWTLQGTEESAKADAIARCEGINENVPGWNYRLISVSRAGDADALIAELVLGEV